MKKMVLKKRRITPSLGVMRYRMSKRMGTPIISSVVAAAVVALVISVGFGIALAPKPQTRQGAEQPRERIIWMEAVEYKGSTETEKLAPPQNLANNPKALGDAYGFKWVEPEKKWEVSAYAFSPSTIVVNQGDKVTLRIFGINGDLHRIYVEGYAEKVVELNRGRYVDITFTADKPGLFELVCSNHEPAMRGWLIVIPRTA